MASFLGIDLSKETFHACLLSDRGEAKKVFPNSPKGFEQLVAWLRNRQAADVDICMEATGSTGSVSSTRHASRRSRKTSCSAPRAMQSTRH